MLWESLHTVLSHKPQLGPWLFHPVHQYNGLISINVHIWLYPCILIISKQSARPDSFDNIETITNSPSHQFLFVGYLTAPRFLQRLVSWVLSPDSKPCIWSSIMKGLWSSFQFLSKILIRNKIPIVQQVNSHVCPFLDPVHSGTHVFLFEIFFYLAFFYPLFFSPRRLPIQKKKWVA